MIPEWTVYDDEVAALAKRVADEQSGVGAFGSKADELEQAVQQTVERDEFIGTGAGTSSTDSEVMSEPSVEQAPRDEL